jgi:NADH dehydrogenase FAD-containing subunit
MPSETSCLPTGPAGPAGVTRLVTRAPVLSSHPGGARRAVLRQLQVQGVEVSEGMAVAAVEAGQLVLEDGSSIGFDVCLWCTQAAAAHWLEGTGLPTGGRGGGGGWLGGVEWRGG